MTTPASLNSLLTQQTLTDYYNAALSIAQQLGLSTTSWQPGDPTRSLFYLESQLLAVLDQIVTGFGQSGFLDYAALPVKDPITGNPLPASTSWLNVLAQQVYNVTVPPATYATTAETLTNAGGGFFVFGPGDLQFSNPTTGATYHNTTGGTLTPVGTPGAVLSITVVADVAGSAGNASANAINTLVTPLLGVTCTNPAAATGIDQQSAAVTIQQCRNKLASLSPNGPAGAYSYVALNSALTGTVNITRCRVYPNSVTGQVQIYVAGPSGLVSPSDVTAAQNAVQTWATPLCITPTVASANAVNVPVTYTLWLYTSVNQTSAQIQTAVQNALANYFANRPIGGDIIPPAATGSLYLSELQAVIGAVFPNQTFKVTVSAPAGDVALNNGDVPVLGVVTGTVNLISGP